MYEDKRNVWRENRERNLDWFIHEQIAAFLPSGSLGRILDYGAGNSPYRSGLEFDKYVSADLAQNSLGSIDHIIRPGQPLPLADGSFDLVLLLDVLEHVSDPDYVLVEIRRLLGPEGRLIMSIPFIYREHETPFDYARYTSFGVENLLGRHGGYVVRRNKVGSVGFTLLSIFLSRGIVNGERIRQGLLGRSVNLVIRKAMPLILPFLMATPNPDDGIYHHLLIEAGFK